MLGSFNREGAVQRGRYAQAKLAAVVPVGDGIGHGVTRRHQIINDLSDECAQPEQRGRGIRCEPRERSKLDD